MPTTVVTGASGKVGWWVVNALVEAGHDVRAVDRTSPPEPFAPDVDFWPVELTDLGDAYQACVDADYVCHIAAGSGSPRVKAYRNNAISTFNVFQAAADLKVKKVACTSSETVYGFIFGQLLKPQYLPVDETHPTAPQNAYTLSKKLGEDIADMFARNHADKQNKALFRPAPALGWSRQARRRPRAAGRC